MRIHGPLTATCLLLIGAAGAAAAQGAWRQAEVPRGSGLDLAAASPVARNRADATFDGDSLRARNGVAPLPGSEAAFEPVVISSLTAVPLQAGTGYLVNDRAGHAAQTPAVRSTARATTVALTFQGPRSVRPGAPVTAAAAPPRWP